MPEPIGKKGGASDYVGDDSMLAKLETNVRSKIKYNNVLSAIDDCKVYDYLRSEIRQKCTCNDDQSVLPENADTAYDQVARMFLPKPQAAI